MKYRANSLSVLMVLMMLVGGIAFGAGTVAAGDYTISGDGISTATNDSCNTDESEDRIDNITVTRVDNNQVSITVNYYVQSGGYSDNDGVNLKLWYHDDSAVTWNEIQHLDKSNPETDTSHTWTHSWTIPYSEFEGEYVYIRAGIEDKASSSDEIEGHCADDTGSSHFDNADQEIQISVGPTARDDSTIITVDQSVNDYNVLSNDDANVGTLSISEVKNGPSHGSWDDTGDDISFTPSSGNSNDVDITYEVTDGNSEYDTAIFSVGIDPTAYDLSSSTNEDNQLSILQGDSKDLTKAAEGSSLSVSQVEGSSGNVGSEITLGSGATLSADSVGSWTYDPNGQFEDLDDGETYSDSFTYRVEDGENDESDQATVSVTVTGVNDDPSANSHSVTTTEDTSKEVQVIDDGDTDPEGHTLTVSEITDGPVHGDASIIDSNSSIQFNPASGNTTDVSITYEVSDGNGGTDTANLTVNIRPTIETYRVSNPDTTSNVSVFVNATSEPLAELNVSINVIGAPERGSLNTSDFNETDTGNSWTYSATYQGTTRDGDYEVTVDTAHDRDGTDASIVGQTDILSIESGWWTHHSNINRSAYAPNATGPTAPVETEWTFNFTADDDSDDRRDYLVLVTKNPAVVDGTVYFTSRHGKVYAVNTTTGDKEWEFPDNDTVNGYLWASPTVIDGTLYVGSHKDSHRDEDTTGANLYAIDATNGSEEWRYNITPMIDDRHRYYRSGAGDSFPVHNGTVYFGSQTGTVHAVNASTGNESWTYNATGGEEERYTRFDTGPAIANDTLYIQDIESNIYALNAVTGDEEWTKTAADRAYGRTGLSVADGLIYTAKYDGEDRVYRLIAYDAATDGTEEKWTAELAGRYTRVSGTPTPVDGTLYITTSSGNLTAFNATTGERLWAHSAVPDGYDRARYIDSSPVVAGNTVYTNHYSYNYGGYVHAVNASSGVERWEHDVSTKTLRSTPTVWNGQVYVGGQHVWREGGEYVAEGRLNAIGPKDIEVLETRVTNPDGQTVDISFRTNGPAQSVNSTIRGAESDNLTLDDFTRTREGAGYVYTTTYEGSSSGTYDVTVNATGTQNRSHTGSTVSVTVPEQLGLTTGDGAAAYQSNGSAVDVAPNVTVTGGAPIDGVTVSFDQGFAQSEDVLGYDADIADRFGIEGGYDANAGVLSLSGEAATDDYQAVLRTIAYDNTADRPATDVDRTVNFSIAAETPSDTRNVTVEFVDVTPPTVDAGDNTTVDEDKAVILDGSGTTDNVGVANYTWSFQNGNTTNATESNGKIAHVYTDNGTFEPTLIATDEAGNTARDTVTINVRENSTLVARPTVSNSPVPEGMTVTFDARNSESSEGIDSYDWDFNGDGTTDATNATASVRYSNPGTYTARLTLTDEEGNTDTGEVSVDVTDTTPPTADAGQSRRTVDEDTPITLDAGGSADYGSGIARYEWDIGDDGSVERTSKTATYNFTDPGTYELSLTVVDGANNTATDTQTLVVTDATAPTADAGDNRTVNVDQSVFWNASASTDNVGIVSYKWDFDGDGTVDQTGKTALMSYDRPSVDEPDEAYEATLTVTDAAGNTATDTIRTAVVDNEPPTAKLSGTNSTTENTTVEFSAANSTDNVGIDSYAWDMGDGRTIGGVGDIGTDLGAPNASETPDNVTVTHNYTSDGNYTVTLTATDVSGNEGTDTLGVTVLENSVLIADAGPGEMDVGTGDETVFNASNSSSNKGIETYEWDFDGDGEPEESDARANHSFSMPGTQVVTLTVTDSEGNNATDTIAVRVHDRTPPRADAGVDERTVDEDTEVTFNGTDSTDNVNVTNYAWDFDGDGQTDATGENTTHNFTDPGTYTATLTASDANGNAASDTQTVIVTDTTDPNADAGGNVTTPQNKKVTLDAAESTDNVGIESYEWDLDDDGEMEANGLTANPSFETIANHRVNLTVTDAAGNNKTTTTFVNVTDGVDPVADAGSNLSAYNTSGVTFEGANSSDNVDVVSYEWTLGDGQTDSGETVNHTYEYAGRYLATLTVEDAMGNVDTDTVRVTVFNNSALVADANASDLTPPKNTSVTFDANDSEPSEAIASYDWDFDGDGEPEANGTTANHTYEEVGTHTALLTVTDSENNTVTDTATVEVLDTTAPTASASAGDLSLDEDESVTFDGAGSTDNVEITDYEWDLDGDNITDATGRTLTHTYADPGTYEVTLVTSDAAGHSANDSLTVDVADVTPPTADISGKLNVTEDTEVRFDATDSTDNDEITGYEWDLYGNDTTDATGFEATPTYTEDGTYNVSLTVEDAANQTATDTVTVTVIDDSVLTVDAGPDRTVKPNAEVSFDGTDSEASDGITAYEWDFDDNATDTDAVSSHRYANPGTYEVTLTVTDLDGDTASDTTNVTVADLTDPTASVSADETVEAGDEVSFDASDSSDNDAIANYTWDLGDDTTVTTTTPAETHQYDEPGTYPVTLTVTDESGNTDTAVTDVTVTDPDDTSGPVSVGDDVAPTADAGSNVVTNADLAFDLNATSSSDNLGITVYEWDIDDDGTYELTGPEPSHSYSSDGEYEVTLRVSDAAGNQNTDTVTVTVGSGSPVISASSYVLSANTTIELSGANTPVPNDVSPDFTWNVSGTGNDTDYTGQVVNHTFDTPGEIDVTLNVSEPGASERETVTFRVEDRTGPVANLVEEGSVQNDSQPVSFNASNSTDNVNITKYAWEFGDGTTDSGDSVSAPDHTYMKPGEYTVTVEAFDAAGHTDTNETTVTVLGPYATVDQEQIDYGETPINASNTNTVLVENDGTVPLDVTGTSFDGDNPSAFTVTGAAADSLPLVPSDEERSIPVTFSPEDTANKSATLTVETNHTDHSITLNGTGITSDIEATNSSLTFDDTRTDETSNKSITLNNTGSAEATIGEVALTGAQSETFSVSEAPNSIAGGGEESFSVTFEPQTPGNHTATVVVRNGSDKPVSTIPVNGSGLGPQIQLKSDSITWTDVGKERSANGSVDFENDGNRALNVTHVSIEGPNSTSFTLKDYNDSVQEAGTGTVDLAFEPSEKGDYTATLVIETNDTASPTEVSLSGTAVAAEIGADPRTANFDSVKVNETAYLPITVENRQTSKTNLSVDSTFITGSDPGPFELENGSAPFTLEPGGNQTLNVSYAPTTTGEKSAQLQIHSDAGNEPQINVWLSSTNTYIVVQEIESDNESVTVNVDGNNVKERANYRVNVSQPDTREKSVGFDALNMSMEEETDFQINTTHSTDAVGGDASEYETNGNEIVQYVRLNHTVDASQTFNSTAVDYRVKKSALPAGASAEDVTLRRYNEGQSRWNVISVTHEGSSDTHHFYSAETPGFSQFVISAPTPAEDTETEPEETETEPEESDTGGSGSGVSGDEPSPNFEVRDVSPIESPVKVGDEREITATVRNLGSVAGMYELKVDGDTGTIASSTVTIKSGQAEQLSVTPVFTEAGTYSVVINGSVIDTITVEASEGTPESTPTTTAEPTETTETPTRTETTTPTTTEEPTEPTTTTTPDEDGISWWPLLIVGLLPFAILLLLKRHRDGIE